MSPGDGSGPHRNAGRTETQPPPSAFAASTIPQPADTTNVLGFPSRLDERRRDRLQLALDHVPVAFGLAAGMLSVTLETPPRRAALRRLEELRAEWHRLVDQSVDRALEEAAS